MTKRDYPALDRAINGIAERYLEAHFAYRDSLAASRAAKAENPSPRRFKLK